MHTETGYIRVRSGDDGDHLEFLVCDPTGISSVFEGSVTSDTDQELVIEFSSTNITGTPSAKPVSALQRKLTITKSEPMGMKYQVNMKAMDQELQEHLTAELEKQPDNDFVISRDKFKELNKAELILVDVREPEEFVNGHLDQAFNSPLGRFLFKSKSESSDEYKLLHDGKKVVVYCSSGGRAKIATNAMRSRGFDHTFAVSEGYSEIKE